jgi:hypothetical protein
MAKKQAPSQQQVPSKESEYLDRSVETIELTTAEIATRAATTTTLLEEMLARVDERRYVTHWGINE